MNDLARLLVRVGQLEGDHVEISIGTVDFAEPQYADIPSATLIAASIHIAGILGRLAVAAIPWIGMEAQQHGCDQRWTAHSHLGHPVQDDEGVCGISSTKTILNPASDLGDPPELWIAVPRAKQKQWVQQITNWLAAMT